MLIIMTSEELERVEVCLNCKNFSECRNIGKFESCEDFVEVEDKVEW